jgi:hypothetical protein
MFARGFNYGLGTASNDCDRILATLDGVAVIAVGIPAADAVGHGVGMGCFYRIGRARQKTKSPAQWRGFDVTVTTSVFR